MNPIIMAQSEQSRIGGKILSPGDTLSLRAFITCDEHGVCQQRKPPCKGCTVHDYPAPSEQHKPFAPGVIDFGARRTSWAWTLARFVWALMFWCLVCGSITVAAILLAYAKGWI